MLRRVAPFALLLSLALTACEDTRKDAVRDYLAARPPEGFAVAKMPDNITLSSANEAAVHVKYRLVRPTVREFDALSTPGASEIADRIDAVRGWALSALPTDHSLRQQIAALSANASEPFAVKRIVTPAGTEVDTVAILKVAKSGDHWEVAAESLDVQVAGKPDTNRDIPLENAPEARAWLHRLDGLARRLESMRGEYLEERRRTAARSLATLRTRLQTGNTFEGEMPDGTTVRLVVTRGVEAGGPVAIVLTVQRGVHSSARYTGGIAQQPSGESIWRAAQVASLSSPGDHPATDPGQHPILTLSETRQGLLAHLAPDGAPAFSFALRPAGKADLIPDTVP